LGHQVVLAVDGLEALRECKARRGKIDLILMDVMMPDMDGLTAAKAIREAHPRSKIILMSGYTDQVPLEADAFLHKPFRCRDLLEVVQRLLV
jgi:CheY-like chemotaxis protein